MRKYRGTYVCTPTHLCATLLAIVHTYILDIGTRMGKEEEEDWER